ncbi:MAG: biopolymer transporter ExbD [Pseudomonadota bacterium]
MRLNSHYTPKSKPEPTIALINIVFLMLIFFLVAAQVAPPLERDIKLVETARLEGKEPPDAMIVMPGGLMRFRGADVTAQRYVTIMQEEKGAVDGVRLVPDRRLSAVKLIEIGDTLRQHQVGSIMIVTERSLSGD